jgi:hypothetical protein
VFHEMEKPHWNYCLFTTQKTNGKRDILRNLPIYSLISTTDL